MLNVYDKTLFIVIITLTTVHHTLSMQASPSEIHV